MNKSININMAQESNSKFTLSSVVTINKLEIPKHQYIDGKATLSSKVTFTEIKVSK